MTKYPNRLWIAALLLGWLFDFLFWKKPTGINFPLFSILCLLGGLLVLLSDGLRPARRSWWLLVPFVFFVVVTFVRREPLTSFLAYTLTLFSLSLFAITYLGGRWMQYGLLDYIGGYVRLAVGMLERPFWFNSEARKLQAESGLPKRSGHFWSVLRGLLIALPVVAIFASLLASADVIFNQQLQQVVELFRLERLPEYIFRGIYILFGAYLLAGALLYAATRSTDEKLAGQDKPAVARFLGFTESSIVLGSLAILFLVFVIIQFRYFFGGHANISIEGYTYSQYARRGFGELVAVAFFTLFLLLGLGSITRREGQIQQRVFSGLGIALVAMVLVMLFSAYQRLVLYESAYGFSRLRTYTHVVLYWIALLLVAVIVLEVLHRERLFAFLAVLAGLGFAVSLSLLNVDAFIVKQNVARELRGDTGSETQTQDTSRGAQVQLDTNYFMGLSDDAVPALVDAYRSAPLPDATKNKLGATLACIRFQRSRGDREIPWQAFHLSTYFADQALAQVDSALKQYKINDKDYPAKAVDPQGGEYPCQLYYYD
jgi:hypothetical protein